MACGKYRIVNTGTQKWFGSYVKDSTSQGQSVYCPPGSMVLVDDVRVGSLLPDDRNYTYVNVMFLGPCEVVVPPSVCDLVITQVWTVVNTDATFNPNGEAHIEINNDPNDYEFSLDNVYWQSSNAFTGLGGSTTQTNGSIPYTAYVRKKVDHTCRAQLNFTVERKATFLFASAEVIKLTSTIGGGDGEVRVTVVSGSGNYTIKFNHEATIYNLDSGAEYQSMVKVGLPAGDYVITVTDLDDGQTMDVNAKITDPEPQAIPNGSFVDVPFMNSIQFVHEDLTVPQTPDNRLLINQYYPGYKKTNYFQKVQKDDFLITQINTDYPNAKCELWNYVTKKFVKAFPEPVVREQNIGATADFDIRIENHTEPGQSRVYFSVGPAPIPISIATSFEILNSADGFNGTYRPMTVAIDPNRGYEYLVINKPWTPVDIDFVSAVGRFEATTDNFNVLEFAHTFNDVANGCYFMVLVGFDQYTSNIWLSEPIDLQVEHKKCNIIQYRNVDNAFGLSFGHGYSGMLRIPSIFGHLRRPVSERSTSRNSDWSLVKISGKKSRGFELRTYGLPPYLHEKLNVLFDTDFYTINGIQYQSNEDYADPSYVDRVLLANSSIKLEQTSWFDKFNSDDIGTVSEGGFIQSNGGFIRR